jgi:hypothetical protein
MAAAIDVAVATPLRVPGFEAIYPSTLATRVCMSS